MSLAELLARGRHLTEGERTVALRKLLQHEATPALFAWLEDYALKGYVDSLGDQSMATHHGCLEHCAGSIHAVQKLRDELVELTLPPKGRPTGPA